MIGNSSVDITCIRWWRETIPQDFQGENKEYNRTQSLRRYFLRCDYQSSKHSSHPSLKEAGPMLWPVECQMGVVLRSYKPSYERNN